MIDIKADEEKIVDRIKQSVSRFQVKPFPDVPPMSYDVKDSSGEILVMFAGMTVPEDSPVITKDIQTRIYRWFVAVYAKNLRTHQGAYEILRQIDDALVGFQLRYHFMRFVETQFLGFHQSRGIWVYRSTYEIIDQSIKGE